jgi:predicted acylesterase/phospholipase RssA
MEVDDIFVTEECNSDEDMNTNEETNSLEESPIIENIVISGGGPAGFAFYGALKQLCLNNLLQRENIKHVFATSAGSMISTMFALNYEWEELDTYLINRPWEKIFKIQLSDVFAAYQQRGLFTVDIFHHIFDPLLLGKGLEPTITLKEFYDYSGIHLHFISTKLRFMNIEVFDHISHPEWQLCDVIYCSCCVPVFFQPFYYENDFYCDGGFISNYPIDICLQDNNDPLKSIGIRLSPRLETDNDDNVINNSSDNYSLYTLVNFLLTLFFHLIFRVNKPKNKTPLFKEIILDYHHPLIQDATVVLSDREKRKELILYGEESIQKYI